MLATTTFDQDDSAGEGGQCPFCGLLDVCPRNCYHDHNEECVGCRAPLDVDCTSSCPLRTGEPSVAMILRFAAKLLPWHALGFGYGIDEAIFAAGQMLADERRPYPLYTAAVEAVEAYLTRQHGPDCGLEGRELLARTGLLVQAEVIALTFYAAAAEVEGAVFDAAAFSDFSEHPIGGRASLPRL